MKHVTLFLAVLVSVALVGCSFLDAGDLANGGDDQGDLDDAFWSLALPDESIVFGSSVQRTNGTTIVLSESAPAGWTVTFTTNDPITASTPYRFDDINALVGGTIRNPANVECSVAAGETNGDVVSLLVGDSLTPTPNGQATFEVSCFGFTERAYGLFFGTM